MNVLQEVYVGEWDAAAVEDVRHALAAKYAAYRSWGQDRVLPESQTFDREFDDLRRGRFSVLRRPGSSCRRASSASWSTRSARRTCCCARSGPGCRTSSRRRACGGSPPRCCPHSRRWPERRHERAPADRSGGRAQRRRREGRDTSRATGIGRREFLAAAGLAGLGALGLSGCGRAEGVAAGGPSGGTLLTATDLPSSYEDLYPGIEQFMDTVAARTAGGAWCDMFESGTLLGAEQLMPGLLGGIAELIFQTSSYVSSSFPILGALQLPFGSEDHAQQLRAAVPGGPLSMLVNEQLARQNLHLLGGMPTTFEYLWTVDRPILRPEDARGLRIRVAGEIEGDTVKALGAAPVTMSSSEVFEALERGTVDGLVSYVGTVVSRDLQEIIRYGTAAHFGAYSVDAYCRADWYASRPPEMRAALAAAGQVLYRDGTGHMVEVHEKEYFPSVRKAGVQLVEPDAAELAALRAAVAPVRAGGPSSSATRRWPAVRSISCGTREGTTMIDLLPRGVHAVTGAMAVLAMVAIGLMMLTITYDVLARSIARAPTDWAYPLNAVGVLMVTALALPYLYATGHHISMDLVYRALPRPQRRAADVVTAVAAAFLGVVLAVTAYRSMAVAWTAGLTGSGTFAIPLWIPDAVLCLAGVFLVLVAVLFPPGPTDDGTAALPGDAETRADAQRADDHPGDTGQDESERVGGGQA